MELGLQSLYLVQPTAAAVGQVFALCLDHHHEDEDDDYHDEDDDHDEEDEDNEEDEDDKEDEEGSPVRYIDIEYRLSIYRHF